jgi:hypothetical protein
MGCPSIQGRGCFFNLSALENRRPDKRRILTSSWWRGIPSPFHHSDLQSLRKTLLTLKTKVAEDGCQGQGGKDRTGDCSSPSTMMTNTRNRGTSGPQVPRSTSHTAQPDPPCSGSGTATRLGKPPKPRLRQRRQRHPKPKPQNCRVSAFANLERLHQPGAPSPAQPAPCCVCMTPALWSACAAAWRGPRVDPRDPGHAVATHCYAEAVLRQQGDGGTWNLLFVRRSWSV